MGAPRIEVQEAATATSTDASHLYGDQHRKKVRWAYWKRNGQPIVLKIAVGRGSFYSFDKLSMITRTCQTAGFEQQCPSLVSLHTKVVYHKRRLITEHQDQQRADYLCTS